MSERTNSRVGAEAQPTGDCLAPILALASVMPCRGICRVQIAHDEWCRLLAGRGACNCNPEIGRPVEVES